MRPWPVGTSSAGGVSVGAVVVNWNTRGLLARLLYGLTHVVAPGHVTEIVVVDNASDDGSAELGAALADAGVIRFVGNTEQRYHGPGLTQGVNVLAELAAERASAVDFVWVLDSDVLILRPDVIVAAQAALAATGAVLAGERADYGPGPAAVTTEPLALCSVIFDPVEVWRADNRPFLQDGEPSRELLADLEARGKTLLAFPFCTAEYILHLGRGTLAEVKRRDDQQNVYRDWAQDHNEPHYGLNPSAAKASGDFERRYRAATTDGSFAALVATLASARQHR